MDDTIENLCEIWIEFINKNNGTTVQLNDLKAWNIETAFPTLTKEQIFFPLKSPELWSKVSPFPGAVQSLKQIMDDGHKVVIVTASSPETICLKLEHVLFKYFPYFTLNDVIITSQKQLIRGDILIDDAPHNLEGGEYLKLLYNAPYNKEYPAEENGMIRVNNWSEVYDIICDISQRKTGDKMTDSIILYSTGCPLCKVLKSKLDEKGIAYEENNSIDEMQALGITQVPMLKVNEELYAFKQAVDWVNNK